MRKWETVCRWVAATVVGAVALLSTLSVTSAAAAERLSERTASAALSIAAPTEPAAGSFVSVPPARIVDSRVGPQIQGPVPAWGTAAIQAAGAGGVPVSGVSAVVLNVTVTEPTSVGFLTVYASKGTRPVSSNLNFVAGQTVPNLVIAPLGSDGKVAFYNGSPGSVHVIADVSGYFVDGQVTAAGGFGAVAPTRVLDTRFGTGGISVAVAPGKAISVKVAGVGGAPSSGLSAVALNLTVTAGTGVGFLTAYASGGTLPVSSNLNFVVGQTVPNLAVVPVGDDGKISLYNGSGGTVHVVADLFGYFLGGDVQVPGGFVSVAPTRVLDTRFGTSVPAGAAQPDGTVSFAVAGRAGVPTSGVSAVALNVTATEPTTPGHLRVYASGRVRPVSSNLNFVAQQTVPNMVIAPVGADGRVSIYNSSGGTVHLVADVSGYTLAGPEPERAGNVLAWGSGSWGSLGQGQAEDSADPVAVSGLTGIKDIAGGYHVGYALRGDGTVWAWGYGGDGELGNAGTADSSSPVQVSGLTDVVSIAGGQAAGYALKRDGTVWAWGYDAQGRLGSGSAAGVPVSTPVQVSGLTAVTSISAGSAGAVVVRSDGSVWTWGAGSSGELGNGGVADSAVPVKVGSLSGIIAVAGGVSGSYALGSDGTVWAWGSGFAGRLGNGATGDSATPVKVSGLTGVTSIASAGFTGYALRGDGTVWAWGYGSDGQLGSGSSAALLPVQVKGLTSVVTVAGGYGGGYALLGDGTVWAWGAGSTGQLGNGRSSDSAVPVQVSGLTGVSEIAGGDFAGYALS